MRIWALDERATRGLIDSQLRAVGWEVDSQTLRYSQGTRATKRQKFGDSQNGRPPMVGLTMFI